MARKKFFAILGAITLIFLSNAVVALPQDASDPFEVKPQNAMPNCDKEYRFKYIDKINSVEEFIAFLKAHQSNDDLYDFKPTQAYLLPAYTLEPAGKDTKNAINLDSLAQKVQVIDLKHSKLSNKKIFILNVWFKDFKENYPWQIMIKASNNGHVSVKFCAGI